MRHAKRAIPRPSRRPILLTIGIGAVAVVGAMLAGGALLLIDRTDTTDPATGSAVTPSPPHAEHGPAQQASEDPPQTATTAAIPTPSGTAPSGEKACTGEIAAARAVVGATQVAASHWAEHVQARTDLLSGKNTQAQTKAIWKRTRLAGPADLQRVRAAEAAYAAARGGCAALDGDAAEAQPCRAQLAAVDAAASAGRAATADWSSHLSMMAAHAAGDFDAAHAQAMWVGAWRAAPQNLDRFRAAHAAWLRSPDCGLS